MEKQHDVPRKTVEGLKIKRHIPLQIGPSPQWGTVYLPSVAQSEVVGRIRSLSVFSQSKLNKHLLGWSCEHLFSSAPLCRPAPCLAGPAFVLIWREKTNTGWVCGSQAYIDFLVAKCTCTCLISVQRNSTITPTGLSLWWKVSSWCYVNYLLSALASVSQKALTRPLSFKGLDSHWDADYRRT